MNFEEVRTQIREMLSKGTVKASQEAEALLRAYISRAPSQRDKGRAMGFLADVVSGQGNNGEAAELFEGALSLVTEAVDRLCVLCAKAVMVSVGRMKSEASSVADELGFLLSVHADEVTAWAPWGFASRSKMLMLLGDREGAVTAANQAVAASKALPGRPGYAEAWCALSEAQEAHGDLPNAIDSLEEAMSVMKDGRCLMGARADHARLSIAVGDVAKATYSLTKAVELPNLQDRRVLATVHRAISALIRVDPEAAIRLTDRLAAYLDGTAPGVLLKE